MVSRMLGSCWLHWSSAEILYLSAASWLFEMLGMDIIMPINPPPSKGHCSFFFLITADYFSQLAEAPLKEVKASDDIRFIRYHVIAILAYTQIDCSWQWSSFVSQVFRWLCSKVFIQNIVSTAYKPGANCLPKTFNETIFKLLRKLVQSSRQNWNKKLGEHLWTYRVESPWFLHLVLFRMGVKQSYCWRFKSHICIWLSNEHDDKNYQQLSQRGRRTI